ncbi:MAG TPA: hypothetical protein VHM70_02860 [Polyangiaceae bacterium]|nr:hypothetical protein [Polyangiaceae bacterium]
MFPALALAFALSGGLTVESSSPDALCPPLALTRQAVEARLGSVQLDGAWIARYGLVHRSGGDFVTLELLDPEGQLKLAREFPLIASDCATTARVIALVLERYFMRPVSAAPAVAATEEQTSQNDAAPSSSGAVQTPSAAAERLPVTPPPSTPEAAAPASAPASTDAKETRKPSAHNASPEGEPRPVPLPFAPRGDVRAGLWWSSSWLAPWLGASWRLGVVEGCARFGFDLRDHETIHEQGASRVRRVPFALGLSRTLLQTAALDLRAELAAAAAFEWAQSVGFDRTRSGLRLVPGALLAIRLEPRLQSRIGPFVELNALLQIPTAAPAFELDGQRVLEPRIFSLGVAFGMALDW